ncbi:MAG: peptidoglycan DD-metalloendopeptidase family protein [Deltaproteobacteria bacterium]|uniref:peptidoglycan DD-metalloendopeptidase family protein n=1 Tax=Candidatus Deferrimicrobium sp. TaxID=3060586 RepID=UPI002723ACF6|nr:peptidoglycan DD-metalloendopeptidase family protein [Candidatus Deferrimicrobium sp.]MCR4310144.1 peptidoglycan DD-metalloendopeptidase family protein [Deltaproteobacteria bacterium]MDO8738658.1 peptidoglycan DD-metalloendopeptidase family protein [Candidatus Deferrimicrobium sp.]
MRKKLVATGAVLAAVVLAFFLGDPFVRDPGPAPVSVDPGKDPPREIVDTVLKGETVSAIFEKHHLDIGELFRMRQASANVHPLKNISAGRPYTITLDPDNNVLSLAYHINDEEILRVVRSEPGFRADKVAIEYERRIGTLVGIVRSNLVSALPGGGESALLAIELSDIFSWDVDFNTDFRKGDTFRILVEERWLDGAFRKYGDILAAELSVDGHRYRAYRFEAGGRADYFDDEGKSMRKAFLKAPLSYRRISSGFTKRRMHPILKIARPHFGVDYAAPAGTPVSTVGDGTVVFAGYKGPNGNLVIVRHPNGYTTSYGHLSRIVKGIRRGAMVRQGDVIGKVGATGLATGPHLDFRIRRHGTFLDPLTVNLPHGGAVPPNRMADFRGVREAFAPSLAALIPILHVRAGSPGDSAP